MNENERPVLGQHRPFISLISPSMKDARYAVAVAESVAISTFTPGPIVEETDTRLR
jgi:hypothetical protein